jgi:transposase
MTACPQWYNAEEIVAKVRQVDVLTSQGQSLADAIRQLGVSEVTYYRWRKNLADWGIDQVKRLRSLSSRIHGSAKRFLI